MRAYVVASGQRIEPFGELARDLPIGNEPLHQIQRRLFERFGLTMVEVERLEDVLYVGRPTYGQAESTVGLFKLVDGGNYAVRVPVRLGRASVSTIEIVDGLQAGDVVILSDMSAWDQYDRVRIK